jgi:hypothetical protein
LAFRARSRLVESLVKNLTDYGDYFRTNNTRVRPGSPCFWYDYVLKDGDHLKHLWFAVSDKRAVVGVLIVGSVERRT